MVLFVTPLCLVCVLHSSSVQAGSLVGLAGRDEAGGSAGVFAGGAADSSTGWVYLVGTALKQPNAIGANSKHFISSQTGLFDFSNRLSKNT